MSVCTMQASNPWHHFELNPTLSQQAEALEKLQQRIIAFTKSVHPMVTRDPKVEQIPKESNKRKRCLMNRNRKRKRSNNNKKMKY